jgi:hypothetical protein
MIYRAPQTEIVCQSYALGKLIHQTTQNGSTKLLDFHLPGLGFWILLMLKRPLEPHCKIIFLRMRVAITSLLRDNIPPF